MREKVTSIELTLGKILNIITSKGVMRMKRSKSFSKAVGLRIKEERNRKGMSQRELARFLGCTVSTCSQYETGKRNPSLEILSQMAVLFRTTTDYLLGIDGKLCEKCHKEDVYELIKNGERVFVSK